MRVFNKKRRIIEDLVFLEKTPTATRFVIGILINIIFILLIIKIL